MADKWRRFPGRQWRVMLRIVRRRSACAQLFRLLIVGETGVGQSPREETARALPTRSATAKGYGDLNGGSGRRRVDGGATTWIGNAVVRRLGTMGCEFWRLRG